MITSMYIMHGGNPPSIFLREIEVIIMDKFVKFKYGVTITCGPCDYYDVYMIDVDEYRIELSDSYGMVIGTINADQIDNCEVIDYDGEGNITVLKDLPEAIV